MSSCLLRGKETLTKWSNASEKINCTKKNVSRYRHQGWVRSIHSNSNIFTLLCTLDVLDVQTTKNNLSFSSVSATILYKWGIKQKCNRLAFGQRGDQRGPKRQKLLPRKKKICYRNYIESFWDPQNKFYTWCGVLWAYLQLLR